MNIFRRMKLNEKSVAQFAISNSSTDKEGYLNKKGELNRGYQRRWFVLKGNLLYYFERRLDKDPIGVIILENCNVELAESGEPYAFQINFAGAGARVYVLGADTPEDMEAWMKVLTIATYEYMKMMVQSLEKSLSDFSSSQNELINIGDVSSSGEFTDSDQFSRSTESSKAEVEYPNRFKEDRYSFSSAITSINKARADTFGRYEPGVATLVDLDFSTTGGDFIGDDGLFGKSPEDILPLSFSELSHLEQIHANNFQDELGRTQSTIDESLAAGNRLVSGLGRNTRSKSERKGRAGKSSSEYGLPPGFRTIPRTFTDDMSAFAEQGSVFRMLHETYGASIWVKVKECGKKDLIS